MPTPQALRDSLTTAAARLTRIAQRLDAGCWNWSPSAGRWSPAQVVEHVILVNRIGSRRLATLAPRLEPPAIDDLDIPYLFYQGDEPAGLADPTGQFPNRADALAALNEAAQALGASAGLTPDLRSRAAAHPLFGIMDGVQWVMFYAAHMERHRAEIIGLEREHQATSTKAR